MMPNVRKSLHFYHSASSGPCRDNLCDDQQCTGGLVSQLRLTESVLGRGFHHQNSKFGYCCVPTGCKRYLESPIRPDENPDAVRVICSSRECSAGSWMHSDCFGEWQQLMVDYVKTSMRNRTAAAMGRNGGGVSRLQGFEQALRACACICGKGYVRKDLDYCNPYQGSSEAATCQARQNRFQQKELEQFRRVENIPPGLLFRDNNPPLRIRTFSFSSTGSSPTSSTATPPLESPRRSEANSLSTPPPRSPTPEETGSASPASTSGNIFRHRTDLSAFRILPRIVQNPYHIKVEDDGPHGNDKIRSFLLTNLTRNRIREVHCAVCASGLPIFDEFPLIDGTFFLSPRSYNDEISVVFERRMVFLNAVCLGCLDGSKTRLLCQGCLSPWDGSSLILGTMYSYDVFAAMSCCQRRLSCLECGRTVDWPQKHLRFFSDFSRLFQCPHCHLEDYHFLKSLRDIFFFKAD